MQALKTLGKSHVSDYTIAHLSRVLNEDDKKILLKEGAVVTDWVYEIIKLISKDENKEERGK